MWTQFLKLNRGKLLGMRCGKAKRILNGQFHIGQTHLRFYAAIFKLHHAVNNALRMNNYLYLVGLQIKQPFGFNHFQDLCSSA